MDNAIEGEAGELLDSFSQTFIPPTSTICENSIDSSIDIVIIY